MTPAERPDAGEGLTEGELDRLYLYIASRPGLTIAQCDHLLREVAGEVERIITARETAAAEAVVGRVEALADEWEAEAERWKREAEDYDEDSDTRYDFLNNVSELNYYAGKLRAALRAGEGT